MQALRFGFKSVVYCTSRLSSFRPADILLILWFWAGRHCCLPVRHQSICPKRSGGPISATWRAAGGLGVCERQHREVTVWSGGKKMAAPQKLIVDAAAVLISYIRAGGKDAFASLPAADATSGTGKALRGPQLILWHFYLPACFVPVLSGVCSRLQD